MENRNIAIIIFIIILIAIWYTWKTPTPTVPVTSVQAPVATQPTQPAPASVSTPMPPAWNGVCSFAGTKCPDGWSDRGLIGYIVDAKQATKMRYPVGAALNPDWTWQHPKLCCNNSGSITPPLTTLSTKPCHGVPSGMIVSNTDLNKTGFVPGGGFNSDWTWQHYNTCGDTTGEYMLSNECPTGWEDRGMGGIITLNGDLGRSPFSPGGVYNSGWTWKHPRICKKK